MDSSVKTLPKSQVELKIEVTADELDQYYAKALSQVQEEFEAQGFRKGHVPTEIVEREIGEQRILAEAADTAVRESYQQTLKEKKLDVISEADVQVLKLARKNPFIFSVKATVLPKIELPDYLTIAKKTQQRDVVVEEKEVTSTLEWLQKSRKKEDEEAPELNDEFAKSVGNFQDMKTLLESIQQGIRLEKELSEKQRMRQEMLENISKEVKVEIPDVLLEQERKKILENTRQGVATTLQIDFPEYLKKIEKTEEELLSSFKEEAEKRIIGQLVLREIAKKENITVGEEELEEHVETLLKQYPDAQTAGKKLDPEQVRVYAEGVVTNEKTFELLEGSIKKRKNN